MKRSIRTEPEEHPCYVPLTRALIYCQIFTKRCSCSASMGGSSSVVERQLPKLNVAGSIPVSRSNVPVKAAPFNAFLLLSPQST